MVPSATIAACAVTLFISLVLPLLLPGVLAWRNRKQGILSAWLLGAMGFLATQIVIRLPILSALSGQAWFLRFSQEHVFWYVFVLAFTAGLFELAGRYAVARLMRKNLTWKRSVAAGMGHGGIEAMVIVGMAYINNIVYIAMIQSGAFDAMLAQVPAEQAVYLESIRQSLTGSGSALFLLAGLERLLAMIAHTAMSVLVCRGVSTGRMGKALLACLGLHTFIDLTAGISLLPIPQGVQYTLIYAILLAVAVVSVAILRRIRSQWQEGKELAHDNEV